MSKKKLPTASITNELEGASLFFTPSAQKAPSKQIEKTPVVETARKGKAIEKVRKRRKKAGGATTPSRYRDSKNDSMIARYHDTTLEVIRKALKIFGKEVSTHRLTPDEKGALADIVYAYRGRGIRTSENEVARIAINYLINDYKENDEHSLLEKILRMLHE